jgi:hypothetical protein
MGAVDYMLLAARLGAGGLVRLALRFVSAIVELFRVRRAFLSEKAHALREEHERRMAALAEATRVGMERLRALAALQAPPVTRSVSRILAGLLLDRLAIFFVATSAMGAIAIAGAQHRWRWPAMVAVALGWLLGHLHLRARRRALFGERLDNHEALVERAGHLAHLFPAAFVVMGHTHTPALVALRENAATYVNVGSWHEAEEDAETPSHRAARTHLVIHPAPSGPTAEFLAWSPSGPQRFERSP